MVKGRDFAVEISFIMCFFPQNPFDLCARLKEPLSVDLGRSNYPVGRGTLAHSTTDKMLIRSNRE